MFIFLDEGKTEICIEDTLFDTYRISVKSQYLSYEREFSFAEGDKEYIADELRDFSDGKCGEVKVIGTSDPFLTLVLCPKGAKYIREPGEDIVKYDLDDKPIEECYAENTIQLELDLCVNGMYGCQFWVAVLSEDETDEVIRGWLEGISGGSRVDA